MEFLATLQSRDILVPREGEELQVLLVRLDLAALLETAACLVSLPALRKETLARLELSGPTGTVVREESRGRWDRGEHREVREAEEREESRGLLV